MSGSSQYKAKLLHVQVKEGRTGLFFATSNELKGLLVAEPTLDALERAIPSAISDLYKASGLNVFVTKLDAKMSSEDTVKIGTPWVAFHADLARQTEISAA